MGTLLNFVIAAASVALQVISTLDLSVMSPWTVYQPKTPKSLLR